MSAQTPSLGVMLRRLRHAAGLSQMELAERAGVSMRTVSNIENDTPHTPRRDTVERLADALNLAPREVAELLAVASVASHAPAQEIATPPDVTRAAALLPFLPLPLLGREREMAALTQSLQRTTGNRGSLCTLTGPAGVGKTCLAQAVAHAVQQTYRDGAVFVSLAALDDPRRVAQAILHALHVQATNTQAEDETLITALDGKQLLLLLDNFEHLIQAAPLVARLLAACPQLTTLVTSRVALRIRGEQEFVVGPLALPQPADIAEPKRLARVPAVALLVQSSQALVPDFQITEANAPAIAELCERLDGLPLALELVAGRLRLFSPQALLQRLGDQIKLVAGRAADRPQRQQTLRSALAWSYDLLPADAQQLFRWLSVFRDGGALSAVEEVCSAILDAAGDATVAELVETLLEQHVIVSKPADDPRIGMLHTIQAFAREKLAASGEGEDAARAHTTYYLALVERAWSYLTGPDQARWLDLLSHEQANWRTALRWTIQARELELGLRLAGALGQYWYMRGPTRDGLSWLEELLRLSDPMLSVDPPDQNLAALTSGRMLAFYEAGKLAVTQGAYHQAQMWLESSAALAESLGDAPARNRAVSGLGIIAHTRGDFPRAATLFAENVQFARQTRNQHLKVIALNNLGMVEYFLGCYDAARATLEECVHLNRLADDTTGVALALANLALVVDDQGDHAGAMALCQECYALLGELGAQTEQARTQTKMAFIACAEGKYTDASQLCAVSMVCVQDAGDRTAIADVLICQGNILLAQEAPADAVACYERSLALTVEMGKWRGMTEAHAHLGDANRDLRLWRQAAQHYLSALALYRKLGMRRGLAPLLEGIALLACLRGLLRRARWIMGQAERLRAELGVAASAYEQRVIKRSRMLIAQAQAECNGHSVSSSFDS